MSIYANVNGKKKISNIFANVNGAKKEIKSVWVNKNGVATKVYGSAPQTPAKFVLLNRYGAVAYCDSLDTNEWTETYINADMVFTTIIYGNGLFIIGGENCIYYSDNGKKWSKATYPSDISFTVNRIVLSGDGKFYAALNNKYLGVSTDGKTWEFIEIWAEGTNTDVAYTFDVAYDSVRACTIAVGGCISIAYKYDNSDEWQNYVQSTSYKGLRFIYADKQGNIYRPCATNVVGVTKATVTNPTTLSFLVNSSNKNVSLATFLNSSATSNQFIDLLWLDADNTMFATEISTSERTTVANNKKGYANALYKSGGYARTTGITPSQIIHALANYNADSMYVLYRASSGKNALSLGTAVPAYNSITITKLLDIPDLAGEKYVGMCVSD